MIALDDHNLRVLNLLGQPAVLVDTYGVESSILPPAGVVRWMNASVPHARDFLGTPLYEWRMAIHSGLPAVAHDFPRNPQYVLVDFFTAAMLRLQSRRKDLLVPVVSEPHPTQPGVLRVLGLAHVDRLP